MRRKTGLSASTEWWRAETQGGRVKISFEISYIRESKGVKQKKKKRQKRGETEKMEREVNPENKT